MINFFFGDSKTAFKKEQFYGVQSSQELVHHFLLHEIPELKNAEAFIAVHQTHSINGLIVKTIDDALTYKPYSCQADFIITHVPNIALGVATADCLPIIFYDTKKHVIAIAHAGWQGSVTGIAPQVAQALHQEFGVNYSDIQIIFGPCANVDMYEVSTDFVKNIVGLEQECVDEVFVQKNGNYYFNLPLYNQLLLEQLGVSNFNYEHNHCTISNHNFCSHRRERGLAQRQISIVMLNQ